MSEAIAIEGAKLALYAANRMGFFDRLRAALKRKHTVLVLGPTGVGKTTLINSLAEWLPVAIDYMNRTARSKAHAVRIKDDHFRFIDTPGQILHEAIRLDTIDREIANASGILNVTAFGYHEYRRGTADGVFTKSGRVSEAYLRRHREIEVEQISEWTNRLLTHQVRPWIMTVVSKADYWFKKRLRVVEHYSDPDGDYARAINKIPNARHSVHEYCGCISRFYRRLQIQSDFDQESARSLRQILLADFISAVGENSDAQ